MNIETKFGDGGKIPAEHTCDGAGISPEIKISEVPKDSKSLVLMIVDIDVPSVVKKKTGIKEWVHWLAYNIPSKTKIIKSGGKMKFEGNNGSETIGYEGPCPPKDLRPKKHRYVFKLFALDKKLELGVGSSKEAVEEAMKKHILDKAEIVGTYESSN